MSRMKAQKSLPALDTGPVPLLGIREQARKQLLELIDSRRGKKALILDTSISGPLSLLDGSLLELLTEHGVIKMLYLESKGLDDLQYNAAEPKLSEIRTITYIVRATVQNAQLVAAQVRGARKSAQPHEFSVIFVPRRTIACERVLEEEGVYGDVSLGEFALELLPYEDDVLSLELDSAFKECVVDGDSTSLFYVSRAIMRLQHLFGLIPRLQGKGPAAVAVRDMCIRMRRENPQTTVHTGASRIDRAILLDREADLLTPMMTQITFEGLIDEVTGIKNGAVPLRDKAAPEGGDFASRSAASAGASTSAAAGAARGSGTALLNSTDPFYREFRDLPYYITTQRLQQYAKDARREYAEIASKDISELSVFVKGIPKLSLLERLSDIAAPVSEQVRQQLFHAKLKVEQDIVEHYDTDGSVAFIEELMYRGAELVEVLRLMVLLSAAHHGISKRHLDSLRQEVLHSYGHQHLLTLDALEYSGLVKAVGPHKSGFSAMRKALRLIVADDDAAPPAAAAGLGASTSGHPARAAAAAAAAVGGAAAAAAAAAAGAAEVPTDISYLYKGYAPLSIRLVETALKTGWAPFADVLQAVPGSQFDVLQTTDAHGVPIERPFRQTASASAAAAASGLSAASHNNGGGAAAPGGGTAGGTSGGAVPPAGTRGTHDGSVPSSSTGAGGTAAAHVQPEVVLVVFIGGVTFAEISALRFLSGRPDTPHRFLVLTTKIINGRTLLQPFIDPLTVRAGAGVGLQL